MTTTLTAPASPTTWEIDPAHTDIGFSVKHLMISTVRGRFGAVRGSIVLDETGAGKSSVHVEIDTASIDTRNAQRDAHLRSPDFFDAEIHPTIDFRSRTVTSVQGRLRIIGDLTIHGVTREVVLDASDEGRQADPWGTERAAFSASTKLDRRDYGLTWNQALETGGVLVSNDITVTLDVQAVRVPATADAQPASTL